MLSSILRSLLVLVLMSIASAGNLIAQHTDATPAPVPPQIATAKKVFIANLGGDTYNGFMFNKGRDYTYNEFYAAMKSWGRFELVSSPADADLIIEVSQVIVSAEAPVIKGDTVGPGYNVELKARFVDPKTHIVLWGFLEHMESAVLKSNRDKNLGLAVTKIVEDVKGLIEPGATK